MSTDMPRTDAVHTKTLGAYDAMLNLASTLERDNAKLREELAHQKYAYDKEFERAEQVEARALAAEKDAERYRWLRSASVDRGNDFPNKWWENLGDALDETFDELIDAVKGASEVEVKHNQGE